ncbi:hypothetical protein RFM26_31270 [Mesorhizobium sp. VK23B]|uniref:Uncharacterized protein n=1 Tax=Mesorhizobium dulcispinae TaxID=3072316 RepID=A0ABU4XPA2_9HYPH|nr:MULTISPECIES: hypothetical protein [unclassified Mesorhizobium]MDX8470161.1 hypothetical protein [Mesorhizobium sp. VK23B]MDX8476563.1 hypothetical protein [Mesorhizobium sp. VK23A]
MQLARPNRRGVVKKLEALERELARVSKSMERVTSPQSVAGNVTIASEPVDLKVADIDGERKIDWRTDSHALSARNSIRPRPARWNCADLRDR